MKKHTQSAVSDSQEDNCWFPLVLQCHMSWWSAFEDYVFVVIVLISVQPFSWAKTAVCVFFFKSLNLSIGMKGSCRKSITYCTPSTMPTLHPTEFSWFQNKAVSGTQKPRWIMKLSGTLHNTVTLQVIIRSVGANKQDNKQVKRFNSPMCKMHYNIVLRKTVTAVWMQQCSRRSKCSPSFDVWWQNKAGCL